MSRKASKSAECLRIPFDRAAWCAIWRTSIGIYYHLLLSLSALGKSEFDLPHAAALRHLPSIFRYRQFRVVSQEFACLHGRLDGPYVCIYPVCLKLQLYDLYTISILNLSMRVLKLKAEYDNYRLVCYTYRVSSTVFLFMPCISFSFLASGCWRSPPRAHTIQ